MGLRIFSFVAMTAASFVLFAGDSAHAGPKTKVPAGGKPGAASPQKPAKPRGLPPGTIIDKYRVESRSLRTKLTAFVHNVWYIDLDSNVTVVTDIYKLSCDSILAR